MGGFGNYVGATLSGDYDDSWVTNDNYPDRAVLQGPDGEFVQLSAPTPGTDADSYTPDSALLGEVPGLLSDHSVYQQVERGLHGAQALNWESRTFVDMRREKDTLKPDQIDTHATAWKDHGNALKTDSEEFKKSVGDVINGKWKGQSAQAAEAASHHVTKTSIYDFTPSSEALANRLTVLSEAFTSIRDRFPTDADDQLIDSGNFDKARLDERIAEFNSAYHLDDGGRLRNNSDGYVAASDAIAEMEKINRSIRDYQLAVQLFRDTYNPTVEAVTADFPNLPAPPNMSFGNPTPGPGAGGPGTPPVGAPDVGGSGAGGGSGIGGPGGVSSPPISAPSFGGSGGGGSSGGSGSGSGQAVASFSPAGSAAIGQLGNGGKPGNGNGSDGSDGSGSGNPGISAPDPNENCSPPASPIDPSDPTCGATSALPGQHPAASLTDPSQAMSPAGLAGGLANGAGQAANQAMGSAMNAAKGVPPLPPNGMGMKPTMPEGALRLGNHGPDGGGGAKGAGGGGAGVGGGGGPRELASRLPSLAAAATHTNATEAAVGTRPAMGTGSMPAAAGAPGAPGAAGHGAGGAQGKEHKVLKALRNRDNGNEVAGEAEAVLAVIGHDAEDKPDHKGRRHGR